MKGRAPRRPMDNDINILTIATPDLRALPDQHLLRPRTVSNGPGIPRRKAPRETYLCATLQTRETKEASLHTTLLVNLAQSRTGQGRLDQRNQGVHEYAGSVDSR